MIICIGREFGSGGHEIGKRLAANLNIPFYDHSLIEAAEDSGMHRSILEKADEKKARPWNSAQYDVSEERFRGLSANDIVYQVQSEFIYEMACKGSCVIIGRCADYILEQCGMPRLSIFILAPFEERVKREMSLLDINEKDAAALVKKTDKQRKTYYNYYTKQTWGDPHNYDLCINSSVLGIDKTAVLLTGMIQKMEELS